MSPRAACRLERLGFDAYDYVGGKADWRAAGLPVAGSMAVAPSAVDLADATVSTCGLDELVSEVLARLPGSWDVCVVVHDGVVVGRLRRDRLPELAETRRVEEVMEEGPTTIRADVPIADIGARMRARRVASVLVTTPEGRLLGVLRAESLPEP